MKAKEIGADLPTINPVVIAAVVEEPLPPTENRQTETPPISLDEFCREFSKENRQVALLGAFHFEMKRKNRLADTAANYRAAFAAFAVAPA